jgi:hypothetical protein
MENNIKLCEGGFSRLECGDDDGPSSTNVSHSAQPLKTAVRQISAKYIYDGVRLHENAVLIVEDGKVKKIQPKEEWETESMSKNTSPSTTTEAGDSA